jgi:hypothetical protein
MNLRSVFTSILLCGVLLGQTAGPASSQSKNSATPASKQLNSSATAAHTASQNGKPVHTPYRPERFAGRAGTYYRLVWGIDGLSVKSAESGEVIRFSYEVLDPQKARMLNDKRLEPALIDERAQVKLVVPMMDKVGKLRQTSSPEPGKTYWMLFSNKGGHVKSGDRVNVVIGNFHANGLVVD